MLASKALGARPVSARASRTRCRALPARANVAPHAVASPLKLHHQEALPARTVPADIEEVLYTEAQVAQRVQELARCAPARAGRRRGQRTNAPGVTRAAPRRAAPHRRASPHARRRGGASPRAAHGGAASGHRRGGGAQRPPAPRRRGSRAPPRMRARHAPPPSPQGHRPRLRRQGPDRGRGERPRGSPGLGPGRQRRTHPPHWRSRTQAPPAAARAPPPQVLKGAFIFMSDLTRAIAEAGLPSVRIDFIKAASYGGALGGEGGGQGRRGGGGARARAFTIAPAALPLGWPAPGTS
jgi:hypothetical protein